MRARAKRNVGSWAPLPTDSMKRSAWWLRHSWIDVPREPPPGNEHLVALCCAAGAEPCLRSGRRSRSRLSFQLDQAVIAVEAQAARIGRGGALSTAGRAVTDSRGCR